MKTSIRKSAKLASHLVLSCSFWHLLGLQPLWPH